MDSMMTAGQRIEWRHAGLIGAFAGALSGTIWSVFAGAMLAMLGIIRYGGVTLRIEGYLSVIWVMAWLALAAQFLFLGVPIGAIVGGLGGLAWRGKPGPYPTIVAIVVGAGTCGVLWLAGVDATAGRENVSLGPLPGLVVGAVVGWLFVRLARRSAAGHAVGQPAITMPRHILYSEVAGFAGVFVGVLAIFAVTTLATVLRAERISYDLASVLQACFLAALPGAALGALCGILSPRRASRPSRRLLAVCALAAGLYCAVVTRLSDPLVVPLFLTGLAMMLSAGLYAARWALVALHRSGNEADQDVPAAVR
jgi:hypothetical protein